MTTVLPLDLPTHQTFEFVKRFLSGSRRVLEVGCGDGRLAVKLRETGHEIVGVELSAEAVRSARAAGLDVRQADFLSFEEEPFDAILFTRSLHHVARLTAAVTRAWELLKPAGLLLAEEFAVEEADPPTAAWFYQVQASLAAAQALLQAPSPGPADPLARWELDHLHTPPLAHGRAMLSAVADRFDFLSVERASYLYRTFCGKLRGDAEGWRLANQIFETEERLVGEGALRPVGLRFVARRIP
ncbi:MAG: class I SAM-dependent methyltransferase [Thermoanaerobaculia bacterium]